MAEPSDPKKSSDSSDKSADGKSKTDKQSAPEKSAGKNKSAEPAKSAAKKPAPDEKTPQSKSGDDKNAKGKTSGSKAGSVPGTGRGSPGASAASSSASAGGSGGRAFVVVAVIAALLAGGAYATKAVWLPTVETYLAKLTGHGADDEDGESLNARLDDLEQKVGSPGDGVMAALEKEKQRVQAELEKALARIEDLERRLTEVREMATALNGAGAGGEVDMSPVMGRIDALEAQNRDAQQSISSLSDKMETIAENASNGGAANGLMFAIAHLRDTALSGRPYAAQLETLQSLSANAPDVIAAASRLNDRAERGLPTMDELTQQFAGMAGDLVTMARTADGDWMEQAAGRLSQLVSLRRTDGKSGDPVEDAVAEIEHMLKSGELSGAVELASALSDRLSGEAEKTLEPWLLDAKARAMAVRALDAMHSSALAGLDG